MPAKPLMLNGGRDRVRTCDPYDVNVAGSQESEESSHFFGLLSVVFGSLCRFRSRSLVQLCQSTLRYGLGLCLLASPSFAADLPGPDEYLAYEILPPPDELLLAGMEMEAAGLVHVLDRSTAELDRYCLDRLPGYGLTAGTHFDACTVPPAADGDVCIILISTAHGARKRELVLNHEYAHCAKWEHPMVWR